MPKNTDWKPAMLDSLGLVVSRVVPPEALSGLLSGTLSLHGGVVRDTAGRIVAHLAMPAATSAFNAMPGMGLLSSLITNYQPNVRSANWHTTTRPRWPS